MKKFLQFALLINLLLLFLIPASGSAGDESHSAVTIREFRGAEAEPYVEAIARLRIDNFREFPYLYDGDLDYERAYLATYFRSASAKIYLVFDGDKAVGFSNSILLSEESDDFTKPFRDKGFALEEYLYIGEAILNPPYRGRKLFHALAKLHEDRIRAEAHKNVLCYSVVRSEDHPLRPEGYKPIEALWTRLGFHHDPELDVPMAWKQVDTGKEEENILAAWVHASL